MSISSVSPVQELMSVNVEVEQEPVENSTANTREMSTQTENLACEEPNWHKLLIKEKKEHMEHLQAMYFYRKELALKLSQSWAFIQTRESDTNHLTSLCAKLDKEIQELWGFLACEYWLAIACE